MSDEQLVDRVRHGTRALHGALEPLWDEIPGPTTPRSLAVLGFANIVRQHAVAQWVLVRSELDVSATALVRPTYEALVRAIWCQDGADDEWIAGFLAPKQEAIESDRETRKGPDVPAMLGTIALKHPEHIAQSLQELKAETWRAMHSYVHGGIRPFVQSFIPFPHKQAASLLINTNGMLFLATNVARMANGLASNQLSLIQKQYADCLPPITAA